ATCRGTTGGVMPGKNRTSRTWPARPAPTTRRARSCAAATGPAPLGIMSRGHPNKSAAANMTGNVIETVMGAVVLVVAAVFLFFAYTTSQVRAVQGYQVTAQFERVGALRD